MRSRACASEHVRRREGGGERRGMMPRQAQGVQETGRTLIVNHAIRNIREVRLLVVCDPK